MDRRYYRELACALRSQGMNEMQVAAVLRDVAASSTGVEGGPMTIFGDAVSHAETFEKRHKKSVGQAFATVCVIIGLVVALGSVFVRAVLRWPELSPSPIILAFVCTAVGLVGGFLLDRRLPRGLGRIGQP